MQIKFLCPKWGSVNITWDNFCARAKQAGYDGIETPIPTEEKDQIIASVKKHDLLLIGQYYQSFEKDYELHKQSLKIHLENLASAHPLLIDSQTGKDFFTSAQNSELFRLAKEVSDTTGIVIAHETHRNKALFAAHVTKNLLVSNPNVVITADFSHWCNVSESLLEQQQDAVDLAISRTIHIHARVGHAESAQVTDPRAEEWDTEVKAHLKWWDKIYS
jgi:sugar phosphate isomerase/epimerase